MYCALERSVPELSVWWDPRPCGGYEKGRTELMWSLGLGNAQERIERSDSGTRENMTSET
jgi:hypothetical protein